LTHAVTVDEEPVTDDDDALAAELAAARRGRWWNRWTLYLGVLVLLLGGFVAGMQVQKSYGTPTSPAAGGRPAGFPTAFPGRVTASSAPEPTTGKVKLVDGTTVYVETASGEVVTVRTNDETAVRVPGTLKDIKAGDTVSVEGAADAEGTVTATSVTGAK